MRPGGPARMRPRDAPRPGRRPGRRVATFACEGNLLSGHQVGRERSRGSSRSIAGLSMAGAGSLDIHKSNWLWTGFGRGTFAARVHTHLEIVHDGAADIDADSVFYL